MTNIASDNAYYGISVNIILEIVNSPIMPINPM